MGQYGHLDHTLSFVKFIVSSDLNYMLIISQMQGVVKDLNVLKVFMMPYFLTAKGTCTSFLFLECI